MDNLFSIGKETEPAAQFVSAILSLIILVLIFFNDIPTTLVGYAIGFLIFHTANHVYVLYPRMQNKGYKKVNRNKK